mmetsp:Transcript_11226/g.28927  ORF Transcript_11226/g.28927 Transcript_11226/m.28927 type:complete len:219 (+) Transcript_11226:2-658(+)
MEEVKPGEKLFGFVPAPPIRPVIGLKEKIEAYKRQMTWKGALYGTAPVPILLGEIGIPFDIGPARDAWALGQAEQAIDAHLRAMEELFLPFCWWNYTPENSHKHGDGWNGEDLSIFCREDGGGRGLRALVRPALLLCAGTPVRQSFDLATGSYRCEFQADGTGASVFFVPRLHFRREAGAAVSASPGCDVAWDEEAQRLTCRPKGPGLVVLELQQRGR